MFTDLAGFTELTQADERVALGLVDELNSIVVPFIKRHHGRKVKSMGDGFLVEFPDALDAVQCAVEMQTQLRERNSQEGTPPLRLRIGVHLGDVERKGDDIVGDAVNLASRVEPFAEPGGICLSEHVVLQVRNKLPYRFEAIGSKTLKGVRDPVDIYRILLPWTSSLASSGAGGPPRIAVLPLANISPDPRDEYFADGLTDELISVLSRLHGLRVIARTSVGQYKATTKTIRQVGSELGVSAVLEGTVRRAGERLRVTLQLIDANSEEHRWAETYDRHLSDVFEIQADIAGRTADALRVELLGSERAAVRRPPVRGLEAYELYLRGIVAYQRANDEGWSREAAEAAAHYFEAAIEKDPGSAAAHATLANLYIHAMGECLARSEVKAKAMELVATAFRLAPDDPEVRTARGNYALQIEHDWNKAEQELRAAVARNPIAIWAHNWLGVLFHALGRYPESIEELRSASELDPMNINLILWQMRGLDQAGETLGAIELAERTLRRNPGSRSLRVELGGLLLRVGRHEDALREARLASGPLIGAKPTARRAELLAALDEPLEARSLVQAWEDGTSPEYFGLDVIAGVYAALGEREKALALLERDARGGDESFWVGFRQHVFDPIRSEPRFLALLKAMNLPS